MHWKVLNGLDFGVPQKRERVLLVGFRHNYPFQFPITNAGPKQTLVDILEPNKSIDPKYFISDQVRKKLARKIAQKKNKLVISPSIWHENVSGNIGIHEYSCALRTGASHNYLLVNGERRLTPREMLRLQGFPDSYKIVVKDIQIKRQAGNAVVIPKIEAVAKAMVAAMQQEPVAARIPVRQGILLPNYEPAHV